MKALRIILAVAVIISTLTLVSCADESDDPGDSLTDTETTETTETAPDTTETEPIEDIILSDGTLRCTSGMLSDIIGEIYRQNRFENAGIDMNSVNRIIIGDFVLELYVEKDYYGANEPWLSIKSMSAFGHTVEFENLDFPLYGNLNTQISITVSFCALECTNNGEIFFFSEHGIIRFPRSSELKDNEKSNLPYCIYRFNEKDGKIAYERISGKYSNSFWYSYQFMDWCIGRDEFYSETGFVTIENGELIFTETKTYTVEEVFDMEAEFEEWYNAFFIDYRFFYDEFKEYDDITMEELFEINKHREYNPG